ncbi:MAG: hypothetical protein IRY89_02805 [Pseudolabrys sp.]|nr:hypothetical protein [Pseudolabrys sp.]
MQIIARCATVLVLLAIVAASRAPAEEGPSSGIMRPEPGAQSPEPWLAPRYTSPRGTPEHVVIPPSHPLARPRAAVPPPIVVPETGRVLPNLRTVSPSGPNGTETYQDRAVRCAHQAGLYGEAAGNRAAYIGSCINQ